ncbi:MAG: RNA polymerase sigma factor (sigma-70 family) [Myxococcota bacterium]|jgi:RNA polymerase sigma factor (sigma-70 family)
MTDRFAEAFSEHERYLWGVSYRMLGSGTGADDVVQDTFLRLLERPPADLSRSLRPWLVRVAMNLARDRLRRRRRQPYVGTWLPEPVPTDRCDLQIPASARYEALESATVAFLVALEALTPQQRAVLLMRDVLDYTVREASGALSMTDANVKVVCLRARRAMAAYDADRCIPRRASPLAMSLLPRLMQCLTSENIDGLADLLANDVRSLTDSGGRYAAARKTIVGMDRVARFMVGVLKKLNLHVETLSVSVQSLNGLPTLVAIHPARSPRWASRTVMTFVPSEDGRLRTQFSTSADDKLAFLGISV